MEATAMPPKETFAVHIRWMIRRDMPEVLSIERAAFEFPWFEEEFIRCLRHRSCIGMVAERPREDRVVGFMLYELHKTRLHILNFAVASEHQRRGVGQQMLDKLIGKLSSYRRTVLSLAIRESNLGAQKFFSRFGFQATEILKDFYEDSPGDAYLFRLTINDVDASARERILESNRLQAESGKLRDSAPKSPKPPGTPYEHILKCAKKGTGCRLSAQEVQRLANEFIAKLEDNRETP